MWATLLAAGLLAPNPVMERVSSSAAEAAGVHARPGRPAARRAPRRAVRHDHRHDHHDDVRRARRGRTITRAVTRVAVGTRVRTLPRNCTTVITRNVSYRTCDGVYYRPYYEGTTVVYVVVEAP
jgi:hypothetical protein